MFEKLYSIEFATYLLAIFTAVLSGVTVYNTKIFQKEQKTSREINWIEKKLENFYNPLIYLLNKREQLVNKHEKTEKTYEKEDIINKLFENGDKIEAIFSKYYYLGSSWENYNTDADISDFEGSSLVDKNEIDEFRKKLIKEYKELSKEHAILMEKVTFRVVYKPSELEKIFKRRKEKK